MIFWHLAATLFLFRWIFRDPKVDVRFLAAGTLAPDAIDMSVGTVVYGDRLATVELWMHSLVAPSLVVVAVLLGTRRGRRRRAWMALAVAMFFHLLIDGLWTEPETFLWPFLGLEFAGVAVPYWGGLAERMLEDWVRWVLEVVGLMYLGIIARNAGLGERDARRDLLRTGRLVEVSAT